MFFYLLGVATLPVLGVVLLAVIKTVGAFVPWRHSWDCQYCGQRFEGRASDVRFRLSRAWHRRVSCPSNRGRIYLGRDSEYDNWKSGLERSVTVSARPTHGV